MTKHKKIVKAGQIIESDWAYYEVKKIISKVDKFLVNEGCERPSFLNIVRLLEKL